MNFQILVTNWRRLCLINTIITGRADNLRVIFFGGVEKFFKRGGQYQIVAVRKVNIFSAGMFDSGVARGAESQIFFVADEAKFFVAAIKFFTKLETFVGRGVVNQNYFKIRERLRQNALDANFYVLLNFVNRHDNRNRWFSQNNPSVQFAFYIRRRKK